MSETAEIAQIINRFRWLIYPLIVWALFWKGLALWKSARNGQKWWYVAILIVNSLGILPIIYLIIDKRKESKQEKVNETEPTLPQV